MAKGERTSGPASTTAKVVRMLTAPVRVLPNFLIIGVQRCGTTSMYEYLVQHPNVLPSLYKEVRYFHDRWRLGPMYYRACFPTRGRMRRAGRQGPAMTFEASPQYIFNPVSLDRIRRVLPGVKLVAILRDPIERAISHHRFVSDIGFETLPFAEALDAEPKRLARRPGESDEEYHIRPDITRFSYLARGRYAEQLQRVVDIFGRDRLHVMCFETFVQDPRTHFGELLAFLGLPQCDDIRFSQYHASDRSRPELTPELLKRLREHFAPQNAALREQFGDIFPWARG
jgi:hypothetical protein